MSALLRKVIIRWPRRSSRTLGSREGFTLIEILIAVLVLALGMLGLGAVFPVVVRQQRQSTDVVLGITALRSAEAYILSHGRGIVRSADDTADFPTGYLNEKSLRPAPFLPIAMNPDLTAARGFDRWLVQVQGTATADPTGDESFSGWSLPDYKWEPMRIIASNYKDAEDKLDVGALWVGYGAPPTSVPTTSSGATTDIIIPMAQRFFPSPDTSSEPPQYIWDFVGRRVIRGRFSSQAVQLAIFVRRIDPGIQVPKGRKLTDVLLNRFLGTSGPGASSGRVPVGANYGAAFPSSSVTGRDALKEAYANQRSTLDGSKDYSVITTWNFKFTGENRLTIEPPSGGEGVNHPIRRAIRQVGQKLVDNRGNVYTVVRLEDRATATDINDTVYIDARVTKAEIDAATGSSYPYQMAFTPQIPAAVSVLTIPR